jgi:hypothetical protein
MIQGDAPTLSQRTGPRSPYQARTKAANGAPGRSTKLVD